MEKCKYFDVEMILIKDMISFLYDTLEEGCGGLCHIVTDDDNIDDSSLKFIIENSSREEYKDRRDKNVSIYICKSLLKLSLIQREFLYGILNKFDGGESSLETLQHAGCLYDSCNGESCPYKDALNEIHAERKCIDENGNNLLFCKGEYPIEEV